jgi:hypothetical protein
LKIKEEDLTKILKEDTFKNQEICKLRGRRKKYRRFNQIVEFHIFFFLITFLYEYDVYDVQRLFGIVMGFFKIFFIWKYIEIISFYFKK